MKDNEGREFVYVVMLQLEGYAQMTMAGACKRINDIEGIVRMGLSEYGNGKEYISNGSITKKDSWPYEFGDSCIEVYKCQVNGDFFWTTPKQFTWDSERFTDAEQKYINELREQICSEVNNHKWEIDADAYCNLYLKHNGK